MVAGEEERRRLLSQRGRKLLRHRIEFFLNALKPILSVTLLLQLEQVLFELCQIAAKNHAACAACCFDQKLNPFLAYARHLGRGLNEESLLFEVELSFVIFVNAYC